MFWMETVKGRAPTYGGVQALSGSSLPPAGQWAAGVLRPYPPPGRTKPVEEAVDFLVPIAQCGSAAGSGGHIPDAGENLDLQAADILPGVPEVCKIIVVIVAAGIPAAGAVRHQPGLLRVDLVQQGLDFRVIRLLPAQAERDR